MKNGLVNRKALGDYVFSRKIELEKLENIIYPILKKKKKEFISLFMEEKILFFDIPLLFQKKLHREFNYIILLWLERKLQLKRVLKRKGMSQEKFDKIFKMQKYDQDEYEKFISLKINTSKDISFVKKELKNFVDEIN